MLERSRGYISRRTAQLLRRNRTDPRSEPFRSGKTIVLNAANRWSGVRLADRQLAERLSTIVPVIYVEPTSSVVSRVREHGAAGLRRRRLVRAVSSSLIVMSPDGLPGLSRRGVSHVNARLAAGQVRRWTQRHQVSVDATIEANLLSPILGRTAEATRVYWAQDDFVGMAPLVGLDPERYAQAEAGLLEMCDLIIAANPQVAQKLERTGKRTALVPFGCDYDLFATAQTVDPAQDVLPVAPMAVFMGQIGERIDLDILAAVLETGVRLLVVGPISPKADVSRIDQFLKRSNVQWVGERSFEELPHYLAHARVGILPYTHSRFNLGSFPLKMLEYLAAGLPVVATSLPAVTWLGSPDVVMKDSPSQFAAAVVALTGAPSEPALIQRRQELAKEHDWDHRAAAFIASIDAVKTR